MPTRPTTTTRPRQGPRPELTEAQRVAVALAEAEGWSLYAEARDGSRVQLRRGRPGYALIIYLAGELPAVTAEE